MILSNPTTGRWDGIACCSVTRAERLLRTAPEQQGGCRPAVTALASRGKTPSVTIVTLRFHRSLNIFVILPSRYVHGPENISSEIRSYLCNQLSRRSNDFAALRNIKNAIGGRHFL